LVSDFEKEDIEQSTHPMVTVTPHLKNAVGVMAVSEEVARGVFTPLIDRETAVPCRRAGVFAVPKGGGDVIVKICEGERGITVSKAPRKAQTNGKKGGSDDDDDEDSDDEDEEEREVREKTWNVGTVLAEAAIRGVKKGGKVEVTVNVGADLGVQVMAREVGGKGGVRGDLEKVKVVENGSAE